MPKQISSFLKIFFVIFAFSLFSIFTTQKASAFWGFGSVLGDSDENESEEKDEDKNEDENENENKDESEHEDEDESKEKAKEAQKRAEEKARELRKKNEEKKELRSTVVNKDNTRTVIKKKIEDNGKVEIESKTYGVDGKVIEEFKSKEEGDRKEAELKAKQFSENGGRIAEMKFKSKEGEDFKIMVKNEDRSLMKVRYDEEHNYVRIVGKPNEDGSTDEENDDDVLIKPEDDGTYEIEHKGKRVNVDFPITVNDEDGSISVLTPNGERILKHMPNAIIEKAQEEDSSLDVKDLNVKEKNGHLVYELDAQKAEKILGLFETRIETLKTYDAESGEELETTQAFWSRVLDTISF